jgi:hypothetical protein
MQTVIAFPSITSRTRLPSSRRRDMGNLRRFVLSSLAAQREPSGATEMEDAKRWAQPD